MTANVTVTVAAAMSGIETEIAIGTQAAQPAILESGALATIPKALAAKIAAARRH